MNGIIFRSFRKRNSSQKNTNTVHSEYSNSGIVPKERALNVIDFYFSSDWLSARHKLFKGATSRCFESTFLGSLKITFD